MMHHDDHADAETSLQEGLVEWAEAVLSAKGLTIESPPEVVKRRAWSIVLRARAGNACYFIKADPTEQHFEAALTQELASRHPEIVVEVLAADERRGWLLLFDGGRLLRERFRSHPDISVWREVLVAYGRLQIEEIGRVKSYLAMGVPDRRPAELPEALEHLLDDRGMVPLNLVEEFSAREFDRLRAQLPLVSEICKELDQSPVPSSLDHGDFHDANIFYQDGHFRIFDWGDSSVGHPFMSLRTAFVSVEYTFDVEERDPLFNDLSDVYLTPWRSIASETELRRAFELAKSIWAIPSALRWAAALRTGSSEELEKFADAVPSLLAELLEALGSAKA